MTKNCEICHTALPTDLAELNWRWHQDCKNCEYCHEEVHSSQIERILKSEDNQKLVKVLVFHQPCRDAVLAEEFKKKPVIITQEQLDYLNRSHLFMKQLMNGNPDLTIETNQDVTDKMLQGQPWFHEMDMDQKFFFLKQVEAVAARMHIAIGKDKNATILRFQQRDAEKYKEVQDYREGQVTKKTENRMKSLTEIERDNEKSNPALKARRKAIEGFMKVGISESDATRMVDGANKPN